MVCLKRKNKIVFCYVIQVKFLKIQKTVNFLKTKMDIFTLYNKIHKGVRTYITYTSDKEPKKVSITQNILVLSK